MLKITIIKIYCKIAHFKLPQCFPGDNELTSFLYLRWSGLTQNLTLPKSGAKQGYQHLVSITKSSHTVYLPKWFIFIWLEKTLPLMLPHTSIGYNTLRDLLSNMMSPRIVAQSLMTLLHCRYSLLIIHKTPQYTVNIFFVSLHDSCTLQMQK